MIQYITVGLTKTRVINCPTINLFSNVVIGFRQGIRQLIPYETGIEENSVPLRTKGGIYSAYF